MVKWLGMVLVLVAAPGLGLWMAGRWKQRLKEIEQLRQMIYLLKGEIVYGRAPLEEAFERVGRRSAGELGKMFEKVARGIRQRQGETLFEIWTAQIRAMDQGEQRTALTGEDLLKLQSLGQHLGYLDVDMQERMLLLYLEQLDLTIGYLREHRQEKCRLYASMGVMGGIFLVIVML